MRTASVRHWDMSTAVESPAVRVWIDITNSPHVPFFRPLIRLLEEDGHEVEVTARAFAQTEQLLELHGVDATIVGTHGGRSRRERRRQWRAASGSCAGGRVDGRSMRGSHTARMT